jgi:hypothetical protein
MICEIFASLSTLREIRMGWLFIMVLICSWTAFSVILFSIWTEALITLVDLYILSSGVGLLLANGIVVMVTASSAASSDRNESSF